MVYEVLNVYHAAKAEIKGKRSLSRRHFTDIESKHPPQDRLCTRDSDDVPKCHSNLQKISWCHKPLHNPSLILKWPKVTYLTISVRSSNRFHLPIPQTCRNSQKLTGNVFATHKVSQRVPTIIVTHLLYGNALI